MSMNDEEYNQQEEEVNHNYTDTQEYFWNRVRKENNNRNMMKHQSQQGNQSLINIDGDRGVNFL